MDNYDDIMDSSIENALSVMESSEDWTEEDILKAMEDDVCIQTCQDILDCRLAMQQEHMSHFPDVEKEWNAFQQKNSVRSGRHWMVLGMGIGIAATLLLVLAFSWLTNFNKLTNDSVVCFQAINEPVQNVTLQTTAGISLSLDNQSVQDELSHIGAVLVQNDSMRLEYTETTEKIQNHLLSTPRGKTFEVVLADGSKVWLNAESRLEYPSRFVGDNRRVKLYGEAYFQIAKDENHPFIVETDGLQTTVLGTEFNMKNYKNMTPHVTLIKGSVKVCNTHNNRSVMLSPGENVRLSEDGSFTKQQVDVDAYVYWRDGYFYFDNISFADIMQEIGRWYNVNVVFADAKVMNYKLRYFCKRDEGIEKAVERLQCMKKAQVKLEGNTIFIK